MKVVVDQQHPARPSERLGLDERASQVLLEDTHPAFGDGVRCWHQAQAAA